MTAKDPERTRKRIILAALRVFLARGYDGASVNEIARSAKVTKGALYHHFDGKGHLFRETLRFTMGEMQKWSLEHFKRCRSSRSLLRTLFGSLGAMRDTFSRIVVGGRGRSRYTFLEILVSAARRDDAVRSEMGRIYDKTRSSIARELQHGQAAGEVRQDIDVHALAFTINAIVEGAVLLSVIDETVDLDRVGRSMFTNMWKMIST
jgi:AcrR family transcriptional regulator